MTTFCTHCSKELPRGAAECPSCGADVREWSVPYLVPGGSARFAYGEGDRFRALFAVLRHLSATVA